MKEIKSGVTKSGSIRYYIHGRFIALRWFPIARDRAEKMLESGEAIAYDPKADNLW